MSARLFPWLETVRPYGAADPPKEARNEPKKTRPSTSPSPDGKAGPHPSPSATPSPEGKAKKGRFV